MAREKPLSPARRLERTLPKLSPLMREAYASMWTDAQCDAWGRKTKGSEVAKQAHDWLLLADKALKAEGSEDIPWSRQRLAWVASLAVQLENELAGKLDDEISAAQHTRDEQLAVAKHLRAKTLSRLVLLVGGNGERSAALAKATKDSRTADEVVASLSALADLLHLWRMEARLRLLADELGLDESTVRALRESRDTLKEADLNAVSLRPMRGDGPVLNRVEGRLLRELRALQLAFETARSEGLNAPKLKVRPALKTIFASHHSGAVEE